MFGQHDHVRKYGPDFEDRLEEAGFSVSTFHTSELVDTDDLLRLGLSREKLFFCEKAAQGGLSEAGSVEAQQPHLDELKNQLIEERQKAQQLENENRRLSARVQGLEGRLQQIHNSNTWKLLVRLGSIRNRLSGRGPRG